MAKLRHVAIKSNDIFGDAEMFAKIFEMEEVGRVGDDKNGAVYLSDGTVNLAVVNMQDPKYPNFLPQGLNHIGFVVDDLDEAIKRAEANGAIAMVDPAHRDAGDTWEMKMRSKGGVDFDFSDHGWPGIKL